MIRAIHEMVKLQYLLISKSSLKLNIIITTNIIDYFSFIQRMLDRDIGTYEAVATNEHGTARQRVRLQIAEYPKFLKRPEEMYVTLRKNCKLEARIIGVPYPEIKWFKDWKPLVDSARIQVSG